MTEAWVANRLCGYSSVNRVQERRSAAQSLGPDMKPYPRSSPAARASKYATTMAVIALIPIWIRIRLDLCRAHSGPKIGRALSV